MAEEQHVATTAPSLPAWSAVSRGLALFLGGFTFLNIAGDLVAQGFDANLWWIDLRPFPAWARVVLLSSGAVLLPAFGLRPCTGRARAIVTMAVLVALLSAVVMNAAAFYRLVAQGEVAAAIPLPLSIIVAASLLTILAGTWRAMSGGAPRKRQRLGVVATVAGCLVAFPLLQMFLFGKTDYRRPADVAVVFGARTYASGKPSDALADRVRTACALHSEGLVTHLLFSGGPGDGEVHETVAMQRMAISLGVPEDAIVLDAGGVSTLATVHNSAEILEARGWRRVLAVSHFYHLPRVKMTYRREGWEVFTVPAKESYLLKKMPYLVAREVAALWVGEAGPGLRRGGSEPGQHADGSQSQDGRRRPGADRGRPGRPR